MAQVETQDGHFNDAFERQGVSCGHARNKRHPNPGPDRGDDGFGIDKAAAREAMDAEEVLIRVDLGLGGGTGEAFGCPLTEAYVKENAEYTT